MVPNVAVLLCTNDNSFPGKCKGSYTQKEGAGFSPRGFRARLAWQMPSSLSGFLLLTAVQTSLSTQKTDRKYTLGKYDHVVHTRVCTTTWRRTHSRSGRNQETEKQEGALPHFSYLEAASNYGQDTFICSLFLLPPPRFPHTQDCSNKQENVLLLPSPRSIALEA